MRNFFTSALVAATVAQAADVFQFIKNDLPSGVPTNVRYGEPIKSTIRKNGFGMTVEEDIYSNTFTETTVKAPIVPFVQDYAQHITYLEKAGQYHEDLRNGLNSSPVYTCSDRNPYGDDTTGLALLPEFGGLVNSTNTKVTFEGKCFKEITMEFVKTSDTTFDINLTRDQAKSSLCSEVIMFANTEIDHFEIFFFKGTHTIHFEMPTKESQDDVASAGINAFVFCENAIETLESLWNTLKMFAGGLSDDPSKKYFGTHVPAYMEEANVKFIKQAINIDMVKRDTKKVEIDPSLIKSGDFLGVMRLDGLDQIIMYGTGAHIGHNVMALRMEDDELYIVESQDAWYWPTPNLQRTKFADWMKQAEDASFHVTWHRMRDEVRANFDAEAAVEFFKQTEGMPYGYYNFLYGWIDTAEDNWPPLLPIHFVPVMFSIIQKIQPDLVYNFFSQALNRRLGTDGLDIQGVVEEGFK